MYKFDDKDHKTVKNLLTGATGIHPGIWQWGEYQKFLLEGGITEPFDTRTEYEKRKEILDIELEKVDREIEEADKKPFVYNGNKFAPDTEFILGMYAAVIGSMLPVGYIQTWKTKDKKADQINNVEVQLDLEGIRALALAYLQFKMANFEAGEVKKKKLKADFLSGVL